MSEPELESYEPFDDTLAATLAPPPSLAKAGPDMAALQQAAERLRAAYHKLSPALVDPEKLTLRFWRTQQRLQWIVANYGRLLPEELLVRFQGRIGRTYLAGPFDESVPSRRAVLRLRLLTRELLTAVEAAASTYARQADHW